MDHPRDRWIGWSGEQRARNLQFIVNNRRFLILPWVHVKGLASAILAQAVRQLPSDWRHHYGYAPLTRNIAHRLGISNTRDPETSRLLEIFGG